MRRVCMIPSHRAPDHVSCLQLGSTRERVYCFWLVRSIKRIFPEYWTPAGQRGQQYPQLALGPVPEHWLRGNLPRVRTTFSHMVTHLVLYPGFLDKIFPEYWPRGPGTHRTLLQYPHGPRPWTLPGSPGMYRCWGHPAQVTCAHLSPGAR